MTTSGTYSFTVTRDDIIRQALLTIGKLDGVEVPEAEDKQDCARMLNMMCKQWMGKADFSPGLKVWTRRQGHLFLSNATGVYTVGPGATGWTNDYVYPTLTAAVVLGGTSFVVSSATGIAIGYKFGVEQSDGSLQWLTVSNVAGTTITTSAGLSVGAASGAQVFAYQTAAQQPLTIEAVVLRDQDLTDTPVKILPTIQDYFMLPNKADPTNTGDPTAIYYEFLLGNSKLYTDVGASDDVTKHLVIAHLEPIQDFNNPLDNPEYPQEWYLPLCHGLAKQVAPMYNKVWTPLMEENYAVSLRIAQNKGAEVSTMFFQPGAED